MPSSENTYALILAGGSGTRFWPLSRDASPKQLLRLFGEETLLEQTIQRLEGLVPLENIFILTNALQEAAVRQIASQIPAENIVAEPAKRDTAPAIALGIGLVAARNPQATMMVLPSDQLIQDVASFQTVLGDALSIAEGSDSLVTIGIKPTWACPSYGYVEREKPAALSGIEHSTPAFEVKRFREKPDPALAESFLEQGNFSWNAGMFIWSVKSVVHQLRLHSSELADFVGEIQQAQEVLATIDRQFGQLTPISIDYALMEKADHVLNLEATFDWDDVGSWLSVGKYLPDQDGNATNQPLKQIDSGDNIVFNAESQTIALLGVQDLIVVNTGDAVLVAHKSKADGIKKIVEQLPQELR
ncbi:MAG: mannose-1-phosphate guanylyltransferase [Verrucomicrobiota bacterium]